MMCTRSAAGGSSARMGVPRLPPTCVSRPAQRRRWAVSAVVVDFPLVPVTAIKGAFAAMRRRSQQNNSTSPITSTAAARASSTDQCGAGWVSGTPGASTSAEIVDQSICRKSAVGMPARTAAATLSAPSSKPTTSAPPARSAVALASPERASPKTATFFPTNAVSGIITRLTRGGAPLHLVGREQTESGDAPCSTARSPQLERGQARQRKHHGDDPEADHNLRLGPAELLEMMMQGCHLEHALAGELERGHLHDHRHGFQHE